jgi:hypothetical protein
MNRLLPLDLRRNLSGRAALACYLGCVLAGCALVLAGCSAGPTLTSTGPGSGPTGPGSGSTGGAGGAAITGRVHGGQNPISGAHVYLYAVNDTGYAGPGIAASGTNAAVSLLTSGSGQDGSGNYYVTTGADGTFSVTGDYTCPTATPYTYVLAVGGNSGSGANSAIALAAALGPCTASGFSGLNVMVNEVSTVAAAFAGAGFASDATHVSSSNTTLGKRGVTDAYSAIVNLETVATGAALAATPAGNGTVPQSEINTLANILAACVNSTGPSSTACTTLFANAMNGAAAPTDTATAMLNIAHNPGANIANLFALQGSSPPFVPDLSKAPNDFTIAINYMGGGMDYSWGISIDANDDVWVTNNDTNGPVTKLNPLGVLLSGAGGITSGGLSVPISNAVDGAGNVWVPDAGDSKLTELSSSGTANVSSPFTGGGLDSPNFIAIDGSNNLWMTNGGHDEISEFASTGTAITSSAGYAATNLSGKYIAADTAGNIWVTSNDPGNGGLFEFNSSGAVSGSSPITTGGLGDPQGVAIDGSGNVWVANGYGDLSEFSSAGAAMSGSGGFTGGGLNGPVGIGIDGAGNVWVANSIGALSEFNSSGTAISGSNGYEAASLDSPVALAIDGSGNVWMTNFDASAGVTEFVGAAAPVVTPMAANLQSPYGAHAVNRP